MLTGEFHHYDIENISDKIIDNVTSITSQHDISDASKISIAAHYFGKWALAVQHYAFEKRRVSLL